jgi:hypothetical protein
VSWRAPPDRQQPQTPPCEEQHPCFFAQLVQLGETVPSQQRSVPPGCGWGCGCGCGAFTVIAVVRWIEPQAAFVAVRVTTSTPLAEAVYWTAKVPVFDPAAGEIALLFADLSDHDPALVTEIVSVAPAPCCSDDGPLIDPEAPGAMLSTVTASSLTPHAVTARAE